MGNLGLLRRCALLGVLGLLAVMLSGCLGCVGDGATLEEAPESALRRGFPEQAERVLGGEERFVAGEGEKGFVLGGGGAVEAEVWREFDVELPREGDGVIRFLGKDGREIRVRESGVEGAGVIAERAVVYRRAGRNSFWTAVPGGVEEWLHLKAGAILAGEAVASWEVEGARLRQDGEAVELVDEGGWVRMRVTAPVAYAAGGREVKARLEGRGGWVELYVEAEGEAVLVDPLWVTVGSMSAARRGHTATLLGNGKLLVAGGGNTGLLASAELYDPATNLWTMATSMTTARQGHTATLLGNGKVLVVGGQGSSGSLASAELYDPGTNLWTLAGSTSAIRAGHTATLLKDGKVLVAGGTNSAHITNADLYDPMMNTWSTVATLLSPRGAHTATLLVSGNVLVAAGYDNGGYQPTTDLYGPIGNMWTHAANLKTSYRVRHSATRIANGNVLVTAGYTNGTFIPLNSAELYDPAANLWTPAGLLLAGRGYHTATMLIDGKVLVAGGSGTTNVYLASAELYDPVTNMWTEAGSMSTARYQHTATRLVSGKVLVVGGSDGTIPLATAELYTPVGSSCTLASDCVSGVCGDGVCCDTACNAGPCDACSVAAGAATDGICAPFTGPACDDGSACTQTDSCQAGTCTGTNPVTCAALDQCHVVGVCNPGTGACSNPSDMDGTNCDDSNHCTQTDSCQMGVCTGSNPVVCAVPDACHDLGTCDPQSGDCSSPIKPVGTICGATQCSDTILLSPPACAGDGACVLSQSQECAPFGCAAGACGTICTVAAECAAGAVCAGGLCTFDGDGDGVKNLQDNCPADINPQQTDTDQDGMGDVCDSDDDNDGVGDADDNCPLFSNPEKKDQNNDGIGDACDCAHPLKSDGTGCDDGDTCTQVDTCQSGTCVGASVLDCPPLGECEVGLCNPANGACLPAHKQDNTPCAGGLCIAGGCFIEGGTSSASGSSGTGGGSSTSSATGSGGMASTSASASTSATTSSGMNAGAGGSSGEINLQGGACGVGRGPAEGAAWIALGLLLARRRRARSGAWP